MSDPAKDERIRELEFEVVRLRLMLDAQGVSATLRHQTRNALGLIRAILRRSAETASSVHDYAAHLEARLDALLRVQAKLIAKLDQPIDLHMLISDELVAHTITERDRLTLRGPAVEISPKRAELLTLAIHELAVNAIKFGAMTVASGRIAIGWSLPLDDLLDLEWTETGLSGLPPSPAFRGFGIETIENMLRYQFDAKSIITFKPEGLHCAIRLPLRP